MKHQCQLAPSSLRHRGTEHCSLQEGPKEPQILLPLHLGCWGAALQRAKAMGSRQGWLHAQLGQEGRAWATVSLYKTIWLINKLPLTPKGHLVTAVGAAAGPGQGASG